MAELITVARPYAEAVYSLAAEQQSQAKWSEALAWLAAMVTNPDVAQVVTNPKHTAQEVEALLLDVLYEKALVHHILVGRLENFSECLVFFHNQLFFWHRGPCYTFLSADRLQSLLLYQFFFVVQLHPWPLIRLWLFSYPVLYFL